MTHPVSRWKPHWYHQGPGLHDCRRGNPFDPHIQCFNPATDFVINVPLDIENLPAGEYRVVVNGVEKTFTLGGV